LGPMTGIEELASQLVALQVRVSSAEAILAIQALKADYGELVDRRFSRGTVVDRETLDLVVDEITELFTEDAVWDGGSVLGSARGRKAIAQRLRAPTLTFSRHLFTKPRIRVDGRIASARWDLLCPCRTPDGRSWWMCGYEDDEYLLEAGAWRHTSMRLTTVFMSETGEGFDRVLA
jgi:hypothetical protein